MGFIDFVSLHKILNYLIQSPVIARTLMCTVCIKNHSSLEKAGS